MATVAETITRICDDISRPESELASFAQREILSAISFYESKRFIWNERLLTVTLSASVGDYAYSFLVANDPEVDDIIAIDDPLKAVIDGREEPIWLEVWRDTFARDRAAGAVTTTAPTYWTHWNNAVQFYPVPNNNLVIQIAAHVRLAMPTVPPTGTGAGGGSGSGGTGGGGGGTGVRAGTRARASTLATVAESPWLIDGEELIRNRATRMIWAKKLQDMEMASLYQNLETESYARAMQAASARHITGRLAVNY